VYAGATARGAADVSGRVDDDELRSLAEDAIDGAVKRILSLDIGVTEAQIRRALRRAADPPADTGPFACVKR